MVNTQDKMTKRRKVALLVISSYILILSSFCLYQISTFYNLSASLSNINYE